ncbi:uncharacterized protein [Drosophila takahashii]|uniref:uncharacterized protein n=1 Tax=Drosophila takahashii TaxID=29030 RepID=UPI001CF8CFEB|nr:uncharacterized protein LOC108067866 [Drosophila takahashii]
MTPNDTDAKRKMWKFDSKNSIICSGATSICFAIIYLTIFNESWFISYNFGVHIAALQILSSIVLILGATAEKYKYFVPWMITNSMFLYLMGYTGIVLLATDNWFLFIFKHIISVL